MALIRLDKFLADNGVASRSELRSIIRAGRVTIDGQTVKKPETKIDSISSQVALDGNRVCYARHHYYMINKPLGVVTATEDKKQETVLDLLSPQLKRMALFPVGRLDKDTSGLLILTNDGDFAHRVISPKFSVEKRYYAEVDGILGASDEKAFAEGIVLKDGTRCRPAGIKIIDENHCEVILTEGKYHQVRRMLASCGKPVVKLRRLAIGQLTLPPELAPGQYVELNKNDLCRVFKPVFNGK